MHARIFFLLFLNSVVFAAIPPRATDPVVASPIVADINATREAIPSFDADLAKLARLEMRYRENKLQQAKLKVAIQRIAKKRRRSSAVSTL